MSGAPASLSEHSHLPSFAQCSQLFLYSGTAITIIAMPPSLLLNVAFRGIYQNVELAPAEVLKLHIGIYKMAPKVKAQPAL